MKSYASTLYLASFTVFELITEHLRKCTRLFTHLPTASITWRNGLAFPNCWNRSSFDPSFSAFYVNCASETVSCEMQGTYAKLTFRTEVFAMCQNNFFPLDEYTAARRRTMHRNSEFQISCLIAILDYTSTWRHFKDFTSATSNSAIS